MIALLALVCGCTEEWRNADIHLDIQGADWADTDRVRVCLDGFGVLEQALGAGRVGITGVVEGLEGPLVINILDASDDTLSLGQAGPVWLDGDQPWQAVDWQPCVTEPCLSCTTSGERVLDSSADWLVVARFL